MHSSHCNHRPVCRCIVLVKHYSLLQFSRPFWNVSSINFQSPELLIQCGFIWKETMQLVWEKVEFNTCQFSLLWHNFFLVILWTFHILYMWLPVYTLSIKKGWSVFQVHQPACRNRKGEVLSHTMPAAISCKKSDVVNIRSIIFTGKQIPFFWTLL